MPRTGLSDLVDPIRNLAHVVSHATTQDTRLEVLWDACFLPQPEEGFVMRRKVGLQLWDLGVTVIEL